jgi:hypothetical protein
MEIPKKNNGEISRGTPHGPTVPIVPALAPDHREILANGRPSALEEDETQAVVTCQWWMMVMKMVVNGG